MVTHCVCRQVPLTVVAHAARQLRAAGIPVTLDTLSDETFAGTGCGTCHPYMARAALTGATVLPVMTSAQCDMWIRKLDELNRAPGD